MVHPKSDITLLKVITFTFLFQNNEFPADVGKNKTETGKLITYKLS